MVEIDRSDSLFSCEEASEITKTEDNQSHAPENSVQSGLLMCSDSAENNGNKSEVVSKDYDRESMNPRVVLQDLTSVLPDIAFKYLTVSCEEVLGKLNNNYVRSKSYIPEQARDLDMDPYKTQAKSGSTYGMYKCVYCTEKKSKRLDWHDSGDSFNIPGIDVALKWAIVALGKKSRTSTIKERNKVCHCCYTKILEDFKKFLQEQIAKSVDMEVHRVDLALYKVKVDTSTCNLVIDPVSLSEDEADADEEKIQSSSESEELNSECEIPLRNHQEDSKEVVDTLPLVQGKIRCSGNTSSSKLDGGEQETHSSKSSPLQTDQKKFSQSSTGENIHEASSGGFPYSKGSKTSMKKDLKSNHPLVESKENVGSPYGTRRKSEDIEATSKKQIETPVVNVIRTGKRGRPRKIRETDLKKVLNKLEEKEERSSLSDPLEYIDDSDEDFQVTPNIKVVPHAKVRTSRRLSEKKGVANSANPSSLEHRVGSYFGDLNTHDQDSTLLSKSVPKIVKKVTNIGKASGKRVLSWDVENIYYKPDQITEACAYHVFSLLLSIDIDGLVSGHSIPRLKVEEFSKGLLLLLCDLQSHFGAPVTDIGLWLDSLMPQELVSKGFSIDYPSVLRFLETGLENVSDVLVPLPEELYKKIPNMSVESTSLSTVMGCLSAVGLDHLVLGSITRLTWKDFTHGFVYSLSKFCEMTAINDSLLMDWLQALSPGGMQFTPEDLKNIVAQVEENPQSYQILSKPVFVPKSSLIEQYYATTAAADAENDLSRIYPKVNMEIQRETALNSGHSQRKHVHKSGVIKRHHTEPAVESPSVKELTLSKADVLNREEENHIAISQRESNPDGSQEKVNKRKLDKTDVHNNTREQKCLKSESVIFKSREKVLQSVCQSEKVEKEETKNKRQKLSLRNLDRKPQCRQDVTPVNSSVEDSITKAADVVIEKRERVELEKCSDDPKDRNMSSSILSSKSRRSSVFKRKKIKKIVNITQDQQELSEQSQNNTSNCSPETETLVYGKRKRMPSSSETKNENSLTDENKTNSLTSSDKGKLHKPVTEKTLEDSTSPKELGTENKKHICVTPRNLGNNTLKKRARTFEEALNMGTV